MPKYCDCEVGTCEDADVERCARLKVWDMALTSAWMEQVDEPDINESKDALRSLRTGEAIVVPRDRKHAEQMLLVAEAYLKGG